MHIIRVYILFSTWPDIPRYDPGRRPAQVQQIRMLIRTLLCALAKSFLGRASEILWVEVALETQNLGTGRWKVIALDVYSVVLEVQDL